MQKLICAEGHDRSGKDTLLDKCIGRYDNTLVYKQNNKPPHYRKKPEEFRKWLEQFLNEQADYLIANKDKNIIMARLFSSEAVFSTLFDRPTIIQNIYNKLAKHFEISQILLLFDDYKTYLNRLVAINDKYVEYNESDFYDIKALYETNFFSKALKTKTLYVPFDGDADVKLVDELLCNR